jgi:hypothetical protein
MASRGKLTDAETERLVAGLREDLVARGWVPEAVAQEIRTRFAGVSGLKAHRLARGWTRPHAVSLLAELLQADGLRVPAWLTGSRLYDWERGARRPGPESLDLLCRLYETRADRLGYGADYSTVPIDDPAETGDGPLRHHVPDEQMRRLSTDVGQAATRAAGLPLLEKVESLRRDLGDVLSAGTLTEAGLDDWERTVTQHGWDARFVPPASLLVDLTADVAELGRVLTRRQPATATRRLTRVAAQLSGLLSLTLVKVGEHAASRGWARTARIAAEEAADGPVRSWVRAQEAYTLFYDANLPAAVAAAAEAQALGDRTPCVGAALAAALEARAQARLGQRDAMRRALERAEVTLAGLDADSVNASAFGYTEAQLRFHEGSAWTAVHDTGRAWTAQARALALCPEGDWMDRTLVHLDRAACLSADGDVEHGLAVATQAMLDLPASHRTGLVLLRARWLEASIPPQVRPRPAFHDFQDALRLPTMVAPASLETGRDEGGRR